MAFGAKTPKRNIALHLGEFEACSRGFAKAAMGWHYCGRSKRGVGCAQAQQAMLPSQGSGLGAEAHLVSQQLLSMPPLALGSDLGSGLLHQVSAAVWLPV